MNDVFESLAALSAWEKMKPKFLRIIGPREPLDRGMIHGSLRNILGLHVSWQIDGKNYKLQNPIEV